MQNHSDWVVGTQAWADFVAHHPELGYRAGKWPFHNFLRFHRDQLLALDAIRLAKRRFWIAHRTRFPAVAFDCATSAPRVVSSPVEDCQLGLAHLCGGSSDLLFDAAASDRFQGHGSQQ
jgi:hypothetical protein